MLAGRAEQGHTAGGHARIEAQPVGDAPELMGVQGGGPRLGDGVVGHPCQFVGDTEAGGPA